MEQNTTDGPGNRTLSPPSPWEFAVSGGACVVIGLTAVTLNVLVLIVVIKNKRLHKPCFCMLSCQAFYCFLMGWSFVTDGVHRLGYITHTLPSHMTQKVCLCVYWSKLVSHTPSALLTCGTACDRLLAVTVSRTYYARWGRRLANSCIVLSVFVAVMHQLVGTLTVPAGPHDVIPCLNYFSALLEAFVIYNSTIDLFLFFWAAIVYAAVISKLKHTAFTTTVTSSVGPKRAGPANTKGSKNEENERFFTKQLSLMPMVKVLVIGMVLFGITPPILASVAIAIGDENAQAEIILYESMLRAAGTLVDFVALVMRCREFQTTLCGLFVKGQQTS